MQVQSVNDPNMHMACISSLQWKMSSSRPSVYWGSHSWRHASHMLMEHSIVSLFAAIIAFDDVEVAIMKSYLHILAYKERLSSSTRITWCCHSAMTQNRSVPCHDSCRAHPKSWLPTDRCLWRLLQLTVVSAKRWSLRSCFCIAFSRSLFFNIPPNFGFRGSQPLLKTLSLSLCSLIFIMKPCQRSLPMSCCLSMSRAQPCCSSKSLLDFLLFSTPRPAA